ncbi:hypothetical protein PRZ48_002721 [Zasmidium cellare]|uniref:Uncharacterized protein n=1 Tax=Zasmidium cellare TaxID=395010 RepID=A0ABR0ET10_ZASCE|nr:hypothetical protein PRZ48_002721 [Zasmidium cellare]
MAVPPTGTTINELNRQHYGTDMPTLLRENVYLKSKLQVTEQDLRRKRAEYKDVKERYRTLESNYRFVWGELDRCKAKLREARKKLVWRY